MKNLLLLFLFLFYSAFALGQTPVSLPATPPYIQDFNTTPAASGTTYPAGWTSYDNTTLDGTMTVGSSTSNAGANYNYGSRIGLLGSSGGFLPGSIIIALTNTSARSGLRISYDIIKIRETSTRANTFDLEYSTTSATSGFLPVTGGTYSSGTLAEGTINNYANLDISALDNQTGTVYLRWYYSDITGGSGARDGIALDNVSVTWNTATPNINLTFDDTGDLNMAKGSNNNVIFRIKADATLANATLNQVVVRTNGTYTNADIAVSGFKLWVSTDATFGGDTQLSAVGSATGNGETLTFSALSSSIPIGTTRYFFVTSDIPPISATIGRTVGITSATTADFTFAAPSTKSVTAAAGNLHTIIGLTTGAVSTSLCVTATQNEPISVPFTYSPTATYSTATFTAQLSNAAGSFAAPTSIGSVVSNSSGSQNISAIIPANTAQGSNYRIRVVSASPVIDGTDNGTNITINLLSLSIAPAATQNLTTFQNGTTLTATESHAISSRRWKYSTVSGSGYTTFLGNSTTETPYFETVGTYYMVVETVFACGKTIISNEVRINVTAFVGTRLFPGDMAIVGWDNQKFGVGAQDDIAITNLVPITQGTTFLFVNANYENGVAANTRTNQWTGTAIMKFTYNNAATLPAGTIISFELPSDSSTPASDLRKNGVATTDFTSSRIGSFGGGVNISSTQADQMYLMQGNFSAGETNFDGYVLFGMTNGANWVAFSSVAGSRTSRLHPHILCINTSHPTGPRSSYFNTSTAAFRNADQRTILGHITNMANWTNGSSALPAAVHTTTFTVTSPTIKSQWIGNKNENWFDCQNWSSLYVPNKYTNVEFTTTAVGSSQIDETASSSDEYLDIAEVKNIILGERTLKIYESRLARLDVYENLTIQNTGILDMDNDAGLINDGTINLKGNWINTVGTAAFEEGESIIVFQGGNNQSITTTGSESFYDVTLNCGQNLTINNPTIIKREFIFQSGNVFAATANPLTFDIDAFHTGANVNRHIRGSSRKISIRAEDFLFPIGKNGIYRPLTAHIQSTVASTQFFAEYFYASYTDIQPVLTPLDHVSQIEHWILNRESGGANARLTLSWGVESIVGNLASLVVAHWTTANQWESRGNSLTTGNITAGTIKSSDIITQFSPFTLGTIDNTNLLPVTWLSFDAKYNKEQDNILLEWKTLSESQNQSFVIERSKNGVDFTEIGIKTGSLNTSSIKSYQFWDFELLYCKTYYRIKQVDTNGNFSYSNIKMIETLDDEKLGITNYQDKTILYSNLNQSTKAKVRIYDMNGHTVGMFEVFLKKGQNELLLPLINISKAVYIYKIELENKADFVSGKFLVK
jgi:hypothetical protein